MKPNHQKPIRSLYTASKNKQITLYLNDIEAALSFVSYHTDRESIYSFIQSYLTLRGLDAKWRGVRPWL